MKTQVSAVKGRPALAGPAGPFRAGAVTHRQRAEVRQILHGPRLQAKLAAGAGNGNHQRDADQVADAVGRAPDPAVHHRTDRQSAAVGSLLSDGAGPPRDVLWMKRSEDCPEGPDWEPRQAIEINSTLHEPAPTRRPLAHNVTRTERPKIKDGNLAVDCNARMWRYQIQAVETESTIKINYGSESTYPAPTPTDDTGPLTNVTAENWKEVIGDFKTARNPTPDTYKRLWWESYRAPHLHEQYHWQSWQKRLEKALVKVRKQMTDIGLSFEAEPSAASAEAKLRDGAAVIFEHFVSSSSSEESAFRAGLEEAQNEVPGDPAYLAERPAHTDMIKRIRKHAADQGWR